MALARDLPDDHPARLNLERYIDRMNRLIHNLVEYVRTEEDTLELQNAGPKPSSLYPRRRAGDVLID